MGKMKLCPFCGAEIIWEGYQNRLEISMDDLTIDEMDNCKWGNSAEETTRESKDEQISIVPEEGKQ